MTGLYLGSSGFLLVLLMILLLRTWSYIEKSHYKHRAMVFIGAVEAYVLMDALFMRCFLADVGNATGFRVIAFIFYLVCVIMPYVWYLFMQSYMEIRCGVNRMLLEAIPVVTLIVLVIISNFNGILWSIDDAGVYARGPIFCIFGVLNLFYYGYTFVQTCYILLTKNRGEKRYILKSSLFSAIPLIGILVNTYLIPLSGVCPFQPYCLVIGVLLAYFFMVEHQKKQYESQQREILLQALEHEKEATRKAREAGAVKNTFLANMSHDIRTPMNAIMGFSDIIAKNPGDEAIVRNAVAKIQASGDILLTIINDVLDLSKIESGKTKIEEVATNLEDVSQHLTMMMEYGIKKKNIEFQVVDHLKNSYVWCDATKLQQILVNVLNNAVKFTPEGGKITLEYKETPINQNCSAYRISVQDTGSGMDEEFQKHAFEAFERERTSTESRIEGTGLGLAIVKKLVDLMEGQVKVQSKPGQGTKVSIFLRFRHAGEKDLEAGRTGIITEQVDLTGLRVLLVEDNELNAEIAREILSGRGLEADWVEDGCDCLAQLDKVPGNYYGLILMDIQMPKMNGYETTRRIRQLSDTQKAQIPIIAMTANAFEEDRKRALDAGMNGFVTKPIQVDALMQAIAEVL